MKYLISVLLGAMSYGILSTIVVKAYEEGYVIGEVVGSQLLTGFLLFWGLAFFIHKRSHYFIVPVHLDGCAHTCNQ